MGDLAKRHHQPPNSLNGSSDGQWNHDFNVNYLAYACQPILDEENEEMQWTRPNAVYALSPLLR